VSFFHYRPAVKWSTCSGHLVKADRLFRGGVHEQGNATSVDTGVQGRGVSLKPGHFCLDHGVHFKEQGYKAADAARALGIDRKQLDRWLAKARAQPASGPAADSRDAELARLREEVRKLRIEKEILKKAAAFFAKESN